MQVKFFCPRWGFEHIAWPEFAAKVKQAGYAGVEWFPYSEKTDPEEIKSILQKEGLQLAIVTTVLGNYAGIGEYIGLLKEQLTDHCTTWNPLFVSIQTGREYFDAPAIDACLDACRRVSLSTGVPIYQETHRNKWSFAAHAVKPVLERQADVNITFDVSHWFCVSESYLEDQQEAVELAISRARHIHARVGHTEGPQVLDPARPEYAEALEQHLRIWDKWIEQQRQTGSEYCTISPEFGPPPYLTLTDHIKPDKEQWRINLWMKDLLHKRYNT